MSRDFNATVKAGMCFIICSLSLYLFDFLSKLKLVQLLFAVAWRRKSHDIYSFSHTETGLEVQGVYHHHSVSVGVRLLLPTTTGVDKRYSTRGDSIKVLVSLVPWFS